MSVMNKLQLCLTGNSSSFSMSTHLSKIFNTSPILKPNDLYKIMQLGFI